MIETAAAVNALRRKFVDGWADSIDVGEGWYRLILDCDAELSSLDPEYRIHQIKEKFGVLRFYFFPSGSCDRVTFQKMKETVYQYEKKSASVCEETGKPGVLMKSGGGWLKTLNPNYAKISEPYSDYEEA